MDQAERQILATICLVAGVKPTGTPCTDSLEWAYRMRNALILGDDAVSLATV